VKGNIFSRSSFCSASAVMFVSFLLRVGGSDRR
jgi:hypothetical protein